MIKRIVNFIVLCILTASLAWAQPGFPERLSQFLTPYPGSTVEQVFTFPKATEATLHVNASIDEVAKFYYDTLTKEGFKAIATAREKTAAFMRFSRGETEFIFEAVRHNDITVYKLSL